MTASEGPSLSQIRENLKDITECGICRETFKDPRTLPCIHTFCRKCLEETASKSGKAPGTRMPCPMCRQEFSVPARGVEELQKNFFMVKLIDMTKHMAALSSARRPCDVCPEAEAGNNSADGVTMVEDTVPPAELFCRNCALGLCSSCVRHHRRSRLTSAHVLVPADGSTSAESAVEILTRPDECERHERERLRLHCDDCQAVVCAFCFIEDHRSHRWSEVDKAADEFRRRIEADVENLAKRNSNLASKRLELEAVKADTNRRLSDLEKLIQGRKTLMQHVIEKHANALVAELGTKRQEKLKEIQLEEEGVELQLANQGSYADYCLEMTAKGSAVDVCRAAKDLMARADDLERMCQSLCQRKIEPVALKCNMPTAVDAFMKDKDKNFIGDIAKDEKATANGRPFFEAFTLESTRITGIAVIGQELFVATEHTSTIKVYSLTNFEPIKDRRICVAGLTRPEDLTASQTPKRLYVFEASGFGKIYRVRPDGVVEMSWPVGDTKCRLSVAQKSNPSDVADSSVVVTYLTKGEVREYAVSKNQARLEQHVTAAQRAFHNYAVKLADDSFLLTAGKLANSQAAHCVFNSRTKRKSECKMNCPEQFLVDECGRVVLIDRDNKRVLLLNSDLEFLQEVISSKDGLVDPLSIAYDEENKRLLVTDFDRTNKTSRILTVRI